MHAPRVRVRLGSGATRAANARRVLLHARTPQLGRAADARRRCARAAAGHKCTTTGTTTSCASRSRHCTERARAAARGLCEHPAAATVASSKRCWRARVPLRLRAGPVRARCWRPHAVPLGQLLSSVCYMYAKTLRRQKRRVHVASHRLLTLSGVRSGGYEFAQPCCLRACALCRADCRDVCV